MNERLKKEYLELNKEELILKLKETKKELNLLKLKKDIKNKENINNYKKLKMLINFFYSKISKL